MSGDTILLVRGDHCVGDCRSNCPHFTPYQIEGWS